MQDIVRREQLVRENLNAEFKQARKENRGLAQQVEILRGNYNTLESERDNLFDRVQEL